ncbi:phosphoglycerate dehydrogenase [Oleispirillum naphthae]|uniref:phosphoglycerate dehydrogenase n=1 Tax=Oleispirillum naphthae TaxID=2838853 RepID=UPI0030824F6D
MSRIAVCAPHFTRIPELRAELLAVYPDADFNDGLRDLAGEELIAFLRGHGRAVAGTEKFTDAVLAAVPELRLIAKIGVGLDTLDLDAMARRGVLLGWTPGVNKRSVSELALCYILAALRRVQAVNADLRGGVWRRQVGHTLSGKTVGIVGCGHIGQDLVGLLAPFGCRLLVHDIRDYPDFYAAHGIRAVGLAELLAEADVVSLHLPLTPATCGLIGARELRLMKPAAVLVNLARGGIVDEAALKNALAHGAIAGAAADVFVDEPWPDRELLALPGFLPSTHIGASTHEAILDMGRAVIRNLGDGRLPDPAWIPDWRPQAAG